MLLIGARVRVNKWTTNPKNKRRRHVVVDVYGAIVVVVDAVGGSSGYEIHTRATAAGNASIVIGRSASTAMFSNSSSNGSNHVDTATSTSCTRDYYI